MRAYSFSLWSLIASCFAENKFAELHNVLKFNVKK